MMKNMCQRLQEVLPICAVDDPLGLKYGASMCYSDAFEGGSCLRMVSGSQAECIAAPLYELEDTSPDPFIVELTVKEHDVTLKLHLQFYQEQQLMLSHHHVRVNIGHPRQFQSGLKTNMTFTFLTVFQRIFS